MCAKYPSIRCGRSFPVPGAKAESQGRLKKFWGESKTAADEAAAVYTDHNLTLKALQHVGWGTSRRTCGLAISSE